MQPPHPPQRGLVTVIAAAVLGSGTDDFNHQRRRGHIAGNQIARTANQSRF
ncbi:hypothetical protein [Nostoc sp. LPT]|uniref:hypothetical protein n=1 Tax=Nostoc sp. LPT TaxID=2815387 RepID=UPI0025E222CE|nr:hypothetical protein [Nostoc sp. LPT]